MADVTRPNTFDATKNYEMVLVQKSRPVFDAEFNEMQDIFRERLKWLGACFSGGNGAPATGFKCVGD